MIKNTDGDWVIGEMNTWEAQGNPDNNGSFNGEMLMFFHRYGEIWGNQHY